VRFRAGSVESNAQQKSSFALNIPVILCGVDKNVKLFDD
jgi:hypothetical protein